MNENIYIDKTVKIGKNVKIYPFNVIMGETEIKDDAIIYPFNTIIDAVIGENCEISSSHLLKCEIGKNSIIGPYARVRPHTKIGEGCKIGNFVEVKNSLIGNNTKASHLSYIGDAEVGEDVNIGCGAIFVNYNGKDKNKIKVGDNAFIGSNVNLIAPLDVAPSTYVCAGSTLTQSTEENDFVIARQKETIKKNRAKQYLKKE